jgi:hypothetical protein
MFGVASKTDGELSGTIHAIDGMFIRLGEGGMTYNTTMNNAKHDNRVNRVQWDDLQHNNEQCQCQEILTIRGAGLSANVGELEGVGGSTTVSVLDGMEGSTTMAVLDGVEGSTTVVVLDRVEGMTYRTGFGP